MDGSLLHPATTCTPPSLRAHLQDGLQGDGMRGGKGTVESYSRIKLLKEGEQERILTMQEETVGNTQDSLKTRRFVRMGVVCAGRSRAQFRALELSLG